MNRTCHPGRWPVGGDAVGGWVYGKGQQKQEIRELKAVAMIIRKEKGDKNCFENPAAVT